jgi:hypothetical protein
LDGSGVAKVVIETNDREQTSERRANMSIATKKMAEDSCK